MYNKGLLSLNPYTNPDFHDYSHVVIKYCDGASFTGDTQLRSHGMMLHFRGRRVLEATLATLQRTEYGLGASNDTHVLLTGCSSGGLAVFLNADRVREALPRATVTKFKAVPGSGFFLHALNVEGDDVYGWEMRQVYHMQNLSASLSIACQDAQPRGEEWRCAMAPYAAAHVRTPLFVLDSAIDAWQLACIQAPLAVAQDEEQCSAAPSLAGCAVLPQGTLADCTPSQLSMRREYAATFGTQLARSGVLPRKHAGGGGGGAFITACHTHCGFLFGDWAQARLPLADDVAEAMRGHGVGWPSAAAAARTYSMQQAVGAWWHRGAAVADTPSGSGTSAEAAPAVYLPCELVADRPSEQCTLAADCPDRSDKPSRSWSWASFAPYAYGLGGALVVASALWWLRRRRRARQRGSLQPVGWRARGRATRAHGRLQDPQTSSTHGDADAMPTDGLELDKATISAQVAQHQLQ